MKVLIVGSGAREHAIAWKVAQSDKLEKLYAAPGNPGIAEFAECVQIKDSDIEGLADFAQQNQIDLTIVGPELPLSLGIVDIFQDRGLKVFGPNRQAAQMESSKSFAKEIMVAAKVPTAGYQEFTDLQTLSDYLKTVNGKIVLKADGLAAGKGVIVCEDQAMAQQAARKLFQDFEADKIIAEDFLEGVEASYIVAVDGDRVFPLAASHDYKPIFDDNQGPNTGGMGTVSPTPRMSPELEQRTLDTIIKPVIAELEKRGIYYRGFLYAGLMISPEGELNVIEFNARLGDPETQVIMRRMDSDLLQFITALTESTETKTPIYKSEAAVCLVLASKGYPDKTETGDQIDGVTEAAEQDNIKVFHAGTKLEAEKLVTAGGRVLSVTATASDLNQAREGAYAAAKLIKFDGMQFRNDIGSLS